MSEENNKKTTEEKIIKKKKTKKTPKIRNLIVIDATNLVVGRLASWTAKQALIGNNVVIVNSEKAVITGDLKKIYEKYQYLRRETGSTFKGPFISRLPDRFLRRIIKKMLPFKKPRGRAAFKRVMCYLGIPPEFEGKAKTLKQADIKNRRIIKFTTIGKVCKLLGYKR